MLARGGGVQQYEVKATRKKEESRCRHAAPAERKEAGLHSVLRVLLRLLSSAPDVTTERPSTPPLLRSSAPPLLHPSTPPPLRSSTPPPLRPSAPPRPFSTTTRGEVQTTRLGAHCPGFWIHVAPARILRSSFNNADLHRSETMLTLETIICTLSVLSVAARADFKARNCSEVREACIGKGFSFAHVPLQQISDQTCTESCNLLSQFPSEDCPTPETIWKPYASPICCDL
ncbi:hypothetical protein EYF80_022709 [Liparis tanakae]|uniref:Uncharacterized protein n=1 Tax=Liparis tanakae TaxID=230148 RepID=A0A4Z2HPZ2_9TELE|nr:hypothetical protein EYF80_022709 [Liparis tanakae]